MKFLETDTDHELINPRFIVKVDGDLIRTESGNVWRRIHFAFGSEIRSALVEESDLLKLIE